MKRKQFLVSLKREWKELVRTRRLYVYIVVAVAVTVVCWLFSATTFTVSDNGSTTMYSMTTRYGMVALTNKLLLTSYLFISLLLVKPLISQELKEKRLVQPFCMGLKPGVHLAAKYVVQILVPGAIGFLASLINGSIAMLVYPQATVVLGYTKIAYVTFGDVLTASLCVAEVIVFYLLLQMSLTALLRNDNVPFACSLLVLFLGDRLFERVGIIFFTPFVFQEYAEKLYIEATALESVLATAVTLAIWALATIISVMVYDDRSDLA